MKKMLGLKFFATSTIDQQESVSEETNDVSVCIEIEEPPTSTSAEGIASMGRQGGGRGCGLLS